MKLTDFYFEDKALIGSRMAILLPDGTDSGEWLNIVSPESDVAVKAGRAFLFAYRHKVNELAPIESKCKESGDFIEYNIAMNEASSDLNKQMAIEIVNGWSFTEEEFSKDALTSLLDQYKALGTHIADFHNAQRKALQEK